MRNPQDTAQASHQPQKVECSKSILKSCSSSFEKTETHAYTDGKVTSYISEDKDSDSNAYSKNADLEKKQRKP